MLQDIKVDPGASVTTIMNISHCSVVQPVTPVNCCLVSIDCGNGKSTVGFQSVAAVNAAWCDFKAFCFFSGLAAPSHIGSLVYVSHEKIIHEERRVGGGGELHF